MCFLASGDSEPQILHLCLFTILDTWKVDSLLKITLSRKLLSLSVLSSMSITDLFLRRRSSGSNAFTIRILCACTFNRRCRIFCTVERGTCSSLLARRVGFDRFRRTALKRFTNHLNCVSVYWRPDCALLMQDTTSLLKLFQPSLDGLYSWCLFSIFPAVAPLHLNNWFCFPIRNTYVALCWGQTAILRSSAVYVSAAPLSALQSINTKIFQLFCRRMQSFSRYL
jgi:hypothetical protein